MLRVRLQTMWKIVKMATRAIWAVRRLNAYAGDKVDVRLVVHF